MAGTTTSATARASDLPRHGPALHGDVDPHELVVRLRRAEGQVRGLQRLVAAEAPCAEILVQTAAISHALHGVALLVVAEHLRSCAAGHPDRDELDRLLLELSRALSELVRSTRPARSPRRDRGRSRTRRPAVGGA